MGVRTLLIGCDNAYYVDWALPLLKSLNYFVPWLELHVHIVNPDNYTPLDYVKYTTEHRIFSNDDAMTAYLQAVRFKVAYEEYQDRPVMIVDADSICTQAFTEQDYDQLVDEVTVLRHPKADRWLAGLVATNNAQFLQDYYDLLVAEPFDLWQYGRDQDILKDLSKQYSYRSAGQHWMKIGKPSKECIFLTLKGDQKTSGKYLQHYNNFKK